MVDFEAIHTYQRHETIHTLTVGKPITRVAAFAFLFSSRTRHTPSTRDWSSDVCSSDLTPSERSAALRSPSLRSRARSSGSSVTVGSEERRVGKECRSGGSPYH